MLRGQCSHSSSSPSVVAWTFYIVVVSSPITHCHRNFAFVADAAGMVGLGPAAVLQEAMNKASQYHAASKKTVKGTSVHSAVIPSAHGKEAVRGA